MKFVEDALRHHKGSLLGVFNMRAVWKAPNNRSLYIFKVTFILKKVKPVIGGAQLSSLHKSNSAAIQQLLTWILVNLLEINKD